MTSEDPKTSPAALNLTDLTVGQSGVIDSVEGDSTTASRLMALGFVPGTSVGVLRVAPMGDPIEYEVRGTRFCLRAVDARTIRLCSLHTLESA